MVPGTLFVSYYIRYDISINNGAWNLVRQLLHISLPADIGHLTSLNVHNAYFYDELEEELYMEQLESFKVKGQEHKVC